MKINSIQDIIDISLIREDAKRNGCLEELDSLVEALSNESGAALTEIYEQAYKIIVSEE